MTSSPRRQQFWKHIFCTDHFSLKSVPAKKSQQDKFSRVHSFPPGRNTLFISVLPLSFPQQQWEDGRVSVISRAQRWAMLSCLVLRILQQHQTQHFWRFIIVRCDSKLKLCQSEGYRSYVNYTLWPPGLWHPQYHKLHLHSLEDLKSLLRRIIKNRQINLMT